jgi:HSP20 family protein
MANITIRRNGGQITPAIPTEWEPRRLFRELLHWDPFREMAPVFAEERAAFMPAFEVKETKEGYTFTADLPGVKEQDLEITMTGSRLSISGKRESEKEEKSDTYYTCERTYGSFLRSFTLPDGIDTEHFRAELKEGVLNLVVPKRPEAQPKKIQVKAGDKPKS